MRRSSSFPWPPASRRRWAAPALASLLLAGCPHGPDDTDDVPSFDCDLGTVDDAGEFVPVADGDRLEMMLGFQGFLFVMVRGTAEDPPRRVDATMGVTIPGEDPIGGQQPRVGWTASGGDGKVTDDVVVFFSSNDPGRYQGKEADLAIRFDGTDERCVATRHVVLADDDKCTWTGSVMDCPDDTGE